MQPEKPILPSTQPATPDSPQVIGIDAADRTKDADIFVAAPPEKAPLDKKGISLVIVFTVIGVIILIAVLVGALMASADGLANDYRQRAYELIKKDEKLLVTIEPTEVFNRRDTADTVETLRIQEQSQPELESVLFVSDWSKRYLETRTLQKTIQQYYRDTTTYTTALDDTLVFDDTIQEIFQKEPALVATIAPNNSLSIRSVSGSYVSFTEKISSQKVPSEVSPLKTQLAKLYSEKASIYIAWAKAVEANDSTSSQKSQSEIGLVTAKIHALVEDEKYVSLLQPKYKKILAERKTLLTQLSE